MGEWRVTPDTISTHGEEPGNRDASLGSYVPANGLKVTIISARGLRKGEFFGFSKSDPYCVCEVPGMPSLRFETPVVSNTTSPVWNYEFIVQGYPASSDLTFSVWDKDEWPKEDDFICGASVPVDEFHSQGTVFKELRLAKTTQPPGSSSHDGPSLLVRVEEVDSKLASPLQSEPSQPFKFQPSARRVSYSSKSKARIEIHVFGVTGWQCGDEETASVQTFCTVEVPGKPYLWNRTRNVRDVQDPSWLEAFATDYSPGDSLVFTFQKQGDWCKNDVLIGRGVLLGGDFYPHGAQLEVVLKNMEAAPEQNQVLKLRVAVAVVHQATSLGSLVQPRAFSGFAFQDRRRSFGRRLGVDTAPESIEVFVASARCSESMDVGPDGRRVSLYCLCDVPGRPNCLVESPAVTNTRDPIWNFKLKIEHHAGDALRFKVVDKFAPKEHNCVGQLVLRSSDIYPSGCSGDFPLMSGSRALTSTLRLKISTQQSKSQSLSLRGSEGYTQALGQHHNKQCSSYTPSSVTCGSTSSVRASTKTFLAEHDSLADMQHASVFIKRATNTVKIRPLTVFDHRIDTTSGSSVRVF